MGNNNSNCVTITPQTPTQSNGDVNNNANNNKNVLVSFINGEKSILARRGRKYADQLLDDLKLKVCKLEPEQIVTKVEDKVLAELQSNQRYRQLITKPLWKESIQSLKPQDIIYRVCLVYIINCLKCSFYTTKGVFDFSASNYTSNTFMSELLYFD